MITWAFAFVPRVPLNLSSVSGHTQRRSTYCRALTLSNALTIKSRLVQNFSLNLSSVSGHTLTSYDVAENWGFIAETAFAAVVDFALPTSGFLNKNCLLRFDSSIRSMSVTWILPWLRYPFPLKPTVSSIHSPRHQHQQQKYSTQRSSSASVGRRQLSEHHISSPRCCQVYRPWVF